MISLLSLSSDMQFKVLSHWKLCTVACWKCYTCIRIIPLGLDVNNWFWTFKIFLYECWSLIGTFVIPCSEITNFWLHDIEMITTKVCQNINWQSEILFNSFNNWWGNFCVVEILLFFVENFIQLIIWKTTLYLKQWRKKIKEWNFDIWFNVNVLGLLKFLWTLQIWGHICYCWS